MNDQEIIESFEGDVDSAIDELINYGRMPVSPEEYEQFKNTISDNAMRYYQYCTYCQVDFRTGEFWGNEQRSY